MHSTLMWFAWHKDTNQLTIGHRHDRFSYNYIGNSDTDVSWFRGQRTEAEQGHRLVSPLRSTGGLALPRKFPLFLCFSILRDLRHAG